MDDRHDSDGWADTFLDAHRTAPRGDRERDREADARALEDLPPAAQWILTRGGREPDLHVIETWRRSGRRWTVLRRWDAIITSIAVVGMCLFAAVFFSLL